MVKGSAEMTWRAKGLLVGVTLLLSACGGGGPDNDATLRKPPIEDTPCEQ